MTLPPYMTALRGFLLRHGANCQGRKGEKFQTDLRLPVERQGEAVVTFRCSCGWETTSPVDYLDARWIGIVALFKATPVTITTIEAGGAQ